MWSLGTLGLGCGCVPPVLTRLAHLSPDFRERRVTCSPKRPSAASPDQVAPQRRVGSRGSEVSSREEEVQGGTPITGLWRPVLLSPPWEVTNPHQDLRAGRAHTAHILPYHDHGAEPCAARPGPAGSDPTHPPGGRAAT